MHFRAHHLKLEWYIRLNVVGNGFGFTRRINLTCNGFDKFVHTRSVDEKENQFEIPVSWYHVYILQTLPLFDISGAPLYKGALKHTITCVLS